MVETRRLTFLAQSVRTLPVPWPRELTVEMWRYSLVHCALVLLLGIQDVLHSDEAPMDIVFRAPMADAIAVHLSFGYRKRQGKFLSMTIPNQSA